MNEENIYEKDHSADFLIENIIDILNDYSNKWRTLGTPYLIQRADMFDMAIRLIENEHKKYKEVNNDR